ncbi:hypothetical protein [Acinetobacter indicus]|uniref:hypothetical protein n=1 Tax=Acinetobacter indicus TaxID=756892 RepID=UPI003988CCFF
MFSSLRHQLVLGLIVAALVALLFWLYLNIQASMYVNAQKARLLLPEDLPTHIEVGNYLQAHTQGHLDTEIQLDQQVQLPLEGKYPANLQFVVTTPIDVKVDYKTHIQIDQLMPLQTSTDLIYQNPLLPKLPLQLDIPIKMSVPFHLQRTYRLPVKILFNGPVGLEFHELLKVRLLHQFAPQLNLNDPMTLQKVSGFNATMRNVERRTHANLDMEMDLKLSQIHP